MGSDSAEFQKFLDNQQYTTRGIRKYERIFGETYVSAGGSDASKELASYLNLKPGHKCMDVGCGLGGNAFYLAKNHGVEVHGFDLSTNMISLAREYANGKYKDDRVSFDVADVTTCEFEADSLDAIYSQSVLLHIEDKLSLFKKFRTWLKPGGRVFITDYTCSSGDHSQAFKDYISQRGYHLLPIEEYAKVLEDAGFKTITAKDHTDVFTEILQEELVRFKSIKEEFIEEFSVEEYDHVVRGWEDKIKRSGEGEHRYGLFAYEK